jgi:low temperature requirement protein LtrA
MMKKSKLEAWLDRRRESGEVDILIIIAIVFSTLVLIWWSSAVEEEKPSHEQRGDVYPASGD